MQEHAEDGLLRAGLQMAHLILAGWRGLQTLLSLIFINSDLTVSQNHMHTFKRLQEFLL